MTHDNIPRTPEAHSGPWAHPPRREKRAPRGAGFVLCAALSLVFWCLVWRML